MSAIKFIQGVARKSLTKNQGSGITTIPGAMQSEAKAAEIVALLQKAGIPMNQLDDFIRSEADVLKFLNIIESASKPKMYSGQAAVDQLNKLFPKKGEVIEFPQKRTFKEEIEAMKKSGDIVDPNNLKKNDKVLQRDMFNNSNLNKTDTVTDTITYIKTLEPVKAMKEANSIIARKGKYKDLTPEQSKRILQDTEDHIFQRDPDNLYDYDPEDMAKGGRAGFYQGGQAQIEPDLSDIGHGSDALMARTRLMSPGAQATTSTGLNYLLAEDNDNMRIPFNNGLKVDAPNPRILELMLNEKMSYEDAVKEFEKRQKQQPYIDERMGTGPGPILEAAEGGRIGFAGGGDPKRRAFLKLMASLTGGAAAFKSGLLSLGEGGTKKAVTETVKQAAGSGGQVPPYFLNLVKKIKNLGDDAPRLATQDRQKVTKYKDFEMTEDITTGEIQIFKKSQSDEAINRFGGENATEEVFMKYKPSETIIGKNNKPVKTGPEYEENTSYISNNRENTGGILDDVDGVPDEVVQEGTVFEDTLSEFGKADGGRIGFSGGGIFRAIIAKSAAKKGLSVTDFIKATNYKGLPPEIRMYISPEDFAKLKGGQKEMYDNYIDMAKTRLEFQKNVEGGMKTPQVAPFFKNLEKTMDEQSFVPKTVTADDIAEMELMVKNRFNKGRKDNAQGGIQTMLGE
jgi:hypothetical protein